MKNKRKVLANLFVASCILSLARPVCANINGNMLSSRIEISDHKANNAIKGTVVDINGEAIIGATIMVKGSNNGTVTNIDGEFTLPSLKKGSIITIVR